jgi:hypothetical protein
LNKFVETETLTFEEDEDEMREDDSILFSVSPYNPSGVRINEETLAGRVLPVIATTPSIVGGLHGFNLHKGFQGLRSEKHISNVVTWTLKMTKSDLIQNLRHQSLAIANVLQRISPESKNRFGLCLRKLLPISSFFMVYLFKFIQNIFPLFS